MSEKVKILPPSRPEAHYVENSQTHEVRFAFATKKKEGEYQLLHKPARCRDFFSDVIYSQRIKEETGNIYGFRWNPKEEHTDRDKTRFYLDCYLKEISENLPILNEIECANGLEPSVLILGVMNGNNRAIIEGDKRWMCSTFLISLYTFLIRAMTYNFTSPETWMKELANSRSVDGGYLERTLNVFPWIISNLAKFGMKDDSLEFISGFKEKVDFDTIHGYSGWFCSTLGRNSCLHRPYGTKNRNSNLFGEIILEAEKKKAA